MLRSLRESRTRLTFGTLAVAALLAPPLAAQEAPDPARTVRAIAPFANVHGRLDWAPKGDLVAYDKADSRGYSQVHIARADLTQERCLTCEIFDFRKRHVGNPVWHPSGKFLVVQVEKPFERRDWMLPFMAVPGRNLGDDLWAIALDGRLYWNLTRRGERGARSLSPRFSYEGGKLAWSERVASGGGLWGEWVIRFGDFEIKRGVPRLTGVKALRPGDQHGFYEVHGFTTDDRGILFSANTDAGQPESGLDLFLARLDSGDTRRLTSTPDQWDRFARLSPNGRKLVWSSSRELPGSASGLDRRSVSATVPLDLWMMDLEGTNVERLTRLNDPTDPHYAGRVMVVALDWSPEGDQLILLVEPLAAPGDGSLFRLQLNQAHGR